MRTFLGWIASENLHIRCDESHQHPISWGSQGLRWCAVASEDGGLTDVLRGGEHRSGQAWVNSVVSTAVVAVLILSALVGVIMIGSTHARAAAPFRSLTVGLVSMNVVTYNPMAITLLDEYVVVYNVYSTLVTYDASYHVRPDLASSWNLSTDQKTWTFNLVHNAFFTDPANPGDRSHAVTSDDVLFSFTLNQQQTGSILHSYTTNIASMSAPDPYTFTVTTNQPFAAMYSTASAISILPKYVWSTINNPVHYGNNNPIGSNAMYYDTLNATFGSNIILRRNPNYYGVATYCQVSRPDQVYFKDYTSGATMVSDFQSGTSGLDAIMSIDPASYLNALPPNSPGSKTTKFAVDTGFVGEISINVMTPAIRAAYSQFRNGANNPLLLNYTVRTAIAMSINKSALVKYALLGLGNVADTLVPDSNPWHYDVPTADEYQFDPVAARAMLNAAGWKYDSGGTLNPAATPLYQKGATNNTVYWPLSFRFFTLNTAPQWQVAALNITAWLGQTGIQTVNARGNPGYSLESVSQLSGAWFTADYDIWFWDWIFTPASDPALDVMEVETTDAIGPTSDNFYSNATFDSIYAQSLTTLDLAARRTLTDTLQKMVYDYRSYILPYYRLDLYAATNGRPPGYTAGWTNYGDWTQSVGLTPDSDLPNLWFQAVPLDNAPPEITNFPSVSYFNTIPTTLAVAATDPENDITGYSWDFGDGSFANTTAASVQHVYAQVGTYAAKVRATDAEWPACASTTVTISQYVPGPPQVGAFSATLSNGTYGLANSTTTFSLGVADQDSDNLFVTWTFGDGRTGTSTTPASSTERTITTTHVYTTAGRFGVTATVTDNQTGGNLPHSITTYLIVTIQYPQAGGGGGGGGGGGTTVNPLINYGIPLAIAAIIVIAAAVVFVQRRRASKEAEREREEPPQSPPPPPPPP